MSGYRRVNYYELCRLCTSSEGTKMHIFREEGRRRQLPSKLQMCLPLQICEDDSLPKIICSHCVEKLESFYDFRNSCVNSEAMLESYFSSLRYSEDFIREGKVYVKDEGPSKKKTQPDVEKQSIKVPNVHSSAGIPVTMDMNNLVQTGSIQIMQPTSVAQGSMVEAQGVRFSYQTPVNGVTSNTTTNVALLKTEDSTQTDFQKELNKAELNQNHQQPMDQGTTFYVRVPNNVEQDGAVTVHGEEGEVVEGEALHQTITFTPNHNQDMLVHFGFNKDNKDQNSSTTILRTDERTSIAQIGEFLQMKTVVVGTEPSVTNEQESNCCDQCGQELNTPELQANHSMNCPEMSDDKSGGSFACESCGKYFKRKEHLFQHRKLHTGERPYVCSTCGKAFSRKEHLMRHSVSHTGQKMHACDMCNKSFSRKDNLYKHRKTHGITGPYECETCGKSFVVKHYYLMHRNSHTTPETSEDSLPYRCDICHKGFSVKQYLTTHKLRHRSKTTQHLVVDSTSNEPESEQQDPLSTVNAAAINVTHHSNNASPMFQVTTGTNTAAVNVTHHSNSSTPLFQVTTGTNTTYLTTAASNALIENYRRLHTSRPLTTPALL